MSLALTHTPPHTPSPAYKYANHDCPGRANLTSSSFSEDEYVSSMTLAPNPIEGDEKEKTKTNWYTTHVCPHLQPKRGGGLTLCHHGVRFSCILDQHARKKRCGRILPYYVRRGRITGFKSEDNSNK